MVFCPALSYFSQALKFKKTNVVLTFNISPIASVLSLRVFAINVAHVNID